MNNDLAGRIMAHAFNDELEKMAEARWNRPQRGAMSSGDLGRASARYRKGAPYNKNMFPDDPGVATETPSSRAFRERHNIEGPKSGRTNAIRDAQSEGGTAKYMRGQDLKDEAARRANVQPKSTRSGLIAATGKTNRTFGTTYKTDAKQLKNTVSGAAGKLMARFR